MSTARRLAAAALAATTLTACGGTSDERGTEGRPLTRFLETYRGLDAAAHYAALSALPSGDHLLIGSFGALATEIYLRACETNGALVVSIQGQPMGCAEMSADLMTALAWSSGGLEGWQQHVEQQRLALLNHLRCQTGEIDVASCAAYRDAQAAAAEGAAQTQQTIADNTSDRCQVGVDLDCW